MSRHLNTEHIGPVYKSFVQFLSCPDFLMSGFFKSKKSLGHLNTKHIGPVYKSFVQFSARFLAIIYKPDHCTDPKWFLALVFKPWLEYDEIGSLMLGRFTT